MCEILCISSRAAVQANDLLREFYADSLYHPHGWGLAWYEEGEFALCEEPLRAMDSLELSSLLSVPILTTQMMAHIRNATRGVMSYENCHPFVLFDEDGRRWVIAHNGTMLNDALLAGYDRRTKGDTDSEQVALYLVDRINEARRLAGRRLRFCDRFSVLASAMDELSNSNKLNLAIDDGAYTYAHTNTIQHTMYEKLEDGTAYVCTRPMGAKARWKPVPKCRLVAYQSGHVARMGSSHGRLFDNDQYLRMLAGER